MQNKPAPTKQASSSSLDSATATVIATTRRMPHMGGIAAGTQPGGSSHGHHDEPDIDMPDPETLASDESDSDEAEGNSIYYPSKSKSEHFIPHRDCGPRSICAPIAVRIRDMFAALSTSAVADVLSTCTCFAQMLEENAALGQLPKSLLVSGELSASGAASCGRDMRQCRLLTL